MLVRFLLIAVLVAGTMLPGGCRCPSQKCVPCAQFAPCAYERAIEPSVTPALTEQVAAERDDQFLFLEQLPSPSDEHRVIDVATCQCHAARNAKVAYLLKLEQRWARILIDCENEPTAKAFCLTRDLLNLREAAVRNQAAGSAVTTFYLLAGAEAQLGYVDKGINEATKTLRRIGDLKAKGLEVPDEVNRTQVSQMLAELRDKKLQLQLARIQLNGQLMRLLGCPLQSSDPFCPRVDWACSLSSVDVEALAAEGMAYRTDVRSVRLAVCRLERATLPVVRAMMSVADPALGAVAPQSGLCHLLRCGGCYDAEEPIRRRQLCTLLDESRETALAKIKGAAFQVAVQQKRVLIARQAVLQRRADLRSMEKLRDFEDTSAFEISLARGRVFTAEATLVEMVVELKVAEVALKQEQGLLVVECGQGAQLCCEPPASYTLPEREPCECETAELVIPQELSGTASYLEQHD